MNAKESFIIEGLAGKKKLHGMVSVNGAKNAALKAMAASVLFHGLVQLENVPNTDDIHTMAEILRKLGAKVNWKSPDVRHRGILEIDASKAYSTDINKELAQSMRASVVLTGPLLARFGKVSFPAPGGCVIGARPIDLFIEGYKKMGAIMIENNGIYEIKGTLKGAEITFNKISVGATETLMMAAVLAKGKTILKNCAIEPEIANITEWLNSCGANIKGIGTPTVEIEGTDGKLLKPKAIYMAIPDRIEAGSFLILGALCAEELIIKNCQPKHLESLVTLLKNAGVPITSTNSTISIKGNSKVNSSFKAFNVKTQEYPGFPTDLQAPIAVFLTQAMGESIVEENIFEGRFKYVDDLKKIGAKIIEESPRKIIIKGPTLLTDVGHRELNAHDIRAGFAMVLAALVGKGQFKINNVHLIDRGYENLENKLRAIGANIKKIF